MKKMAMVLLLVMTSGVAMADPWASGVYRAVPVGSPQWDDYQGRYYTRMAVYGRYGREIVEVPMVAPRVIRAVSVATSRRSFRGSIVVSF